MLTSYKIKNRRPFDARLSATAFALIARHAVPAQPTSPLTIDEVLRRVVTDSPRLAAQSHATKAARAAITPAGRLPRHKLTLTEDNLPVGGTARWSLNCHDPPHPRRSAASMAVTPAPKARKEAYAKFCRHPAQPMRRFLLIS